MSNEQYLIVSYSVMALLAAAAGWAAGVRLRAPMDNVVEVVRAELLPFVRNVSPAGFILVAIAGFCSVSYRGCIDHKTYAEIVADRSYLIDKNHQQAGASIAYLKWAVLAWCVFALIILVAQPKRSSGSTAPRSANPHVPSPR